MVETLCNLVFWRYFGVCFDGGVGSWVGTSVVGLM